MGGGLFKEALLKSNNNFNMLKNFKMLPFFTEQNGNDLETRRKEIEAV